MEWKTGRLYRTLQKQVRHKLIVCVCVCVCFFFLLKILSRFCIAKALTFFSTPEHEVLMVSNCDQSLCVVRRPCFLL